MTARQQAIVIRCGQECEACLRIAAQCAAQDDDFHAAEFRGYAADWSARAFEAVQA